MIADEKAGFRAMRETVGLTQQRLADVLGMTVMSVKHWESKKCTTYPPIKAWKVLERYRSVQLAQVRYAVDDVVARYDGDGLKCVNLAYWRSREDFAKAHPDDCPDDYTCANATARLIAHELEVKGYEVEFGFGGLREMEEGQ